MDKVEKINGSLVHHGKYNDRAYLMKYDSKRANELIETLDSLCDNNDYGKIITKIPVNDKELFLSEGYEQEAFVPKYYNNGTDCVFLSKYIDKKRQQTNNQILLKSVLQAAKSKSKKVISDFPCNISVSRMGEKNIISMVKLYREVFNKYPFPIHDPNYIKEIMNDNVQFYGVIKNSKLIAIASSEMDKKNKNCEMTDFAILPEHRGNGYAYLLLQFMESEMRKQQYKVLYTIARASSYGMNITFSKCNYSYSGTLVNNTNISEGIESMNVWYKCI